MSQRAYDAFLLLAGLIVAVLLWIALWVAETGGPWGHETSRLRVESTTDAVRTTILPPLVMEVTTTSVAPAPKVAAKYRPSGPVVDQIRAAFARFGPVVAEQAVEVAACETGHTFDPESRNGEHAGLFQISRTWHADRITRLGFTWQQMFSVGPNLVVAVDIYDESGWGPWTCKP